MENLLKTLLPFFILIFFIACENDDSEDDLTDDGNAISECSNSPQFYDNQHEMLFSQLGAACVEELGDNAVDRRIGHAQLTESPASSDCTIEDKYYFKLHFGWTDIDNDFNTFDIDIYILSDVKPSPGDNLDLSDNHINVYFTKEFGVFYKATSGLLNITESSTSDFQGDFTFTASEFNIDESFDSAVKGLGTFVEEGASVNITGVFFGVDLGKVCGE